MCGRRKRVRAMYAFREEHLMDPAKLLDADHREAEQLVAKITHTEGLGRRGRTARALAPQMAS